MDKSPKKPPADVDQTQSLELTMRDALDGLSELALSKAFNPGDACPDMHIEHPDNYQQSRSAGKIYSFYQLKLLRLLKS